MLKRNTKEKLQIKALKDKETAKGAVKDAWNLIWKRGNIWALAVGVLIGSVFGAVITSLANDVIMAAIAKAIGFDDVQKWQVHGILIGKFLSTLLTFLIIVVCLVAATSIALFIWRSIVRKKAKSEQTLPEAVKAPTTEELILQELKELNKNLNENKKTKK